MGDGSAPGFIFAFQVLFCIEFKSIPLHVSVTPIEVKEIVYQAVPYVGIAKVFDFIHATNEIFELIRDVGFDHVDAGPLQIARYTAPFALLVGELAYGGENGPELAYRFEWFDK